MFNIKKDGYHFRVVPSPGEASGIQLEFGEDPVKGTICMINGASIEEGLINLVKAHINLINENNALRNTMRVINISLEESLDRRYQNIKEK